MNTYMKERRDEGFTLIELLIAIVVVGILTAVVIVGIGGLNDTGKKGACQASLDAAKAGAAVHYANEGAYPANFDDMINHVPRSELDLGAGVDHPNATTIQHGTGGADWKIVIGAGGANVNTWTVTPANCG